jgi:hypothetical protein
MSVKGNEREQISRVDGAGKKDIKVDVDIIKVSHSRACTVHSHQRSICNKSNVSENL